MLFKDAVNWELSRILEELTISGLEFGEAEVKALSPYLTRHIKRFGDYVLDLSREPEPFDGRLRLEKTPAQVTAGRLRWRRCG